MKSVAAMMGCIIILIAWELSSMFGLTSPLMMGNIPRPITIAKELLALFYSPVFYWHIFSSAMRVVGGFGFAFVLAIILALASIRFPTLVSVCVGPLESLRPIPLIAMVPIVTLTIPSNEFSIVAITFLASLFPLISSVRLALNQFPREYAELAKILNCTGFKFTANFFLPHLFPYIISGAITAMGTAWMGVITAEMMSGKSGIGFFTYDASSIMQHETMCAGIVAIGIIGWLSVRTVKTIQNAFSSRFPRGETC